MHDEIRAGDVDAGANLGVASHVHRDPANCVPFTRLKNVGTRGPVIQAREHDIIAAFEQCTCEPLPNETPASRDENLHDQPPVRVILVLTAVDMAYKPSGTG